MTAQTKGRIRHVALSVEDPWETAEFYKQAVGLQEVTELDGPLAEVVFLTDGVVNLRRKAPARISSASTISASGSMTWWSNARSRATPARPGSWAIRTIPTATR